MRSAFREEKESVRKAGYGKGNSNLVESGERDQRLEMARCKYKKLSRAHPYLIDHCLAIAHCSVHCWTPVISSSAELPFVAAIIP